MVTVDMVSFVYKLFACAAVTGSCPVVVAKTAVVLACLLLTMGGNPSFGGVYRSYMEVVLIVHIRH